jgi:hypothetical protein
MDDVTRKWWWEAAKEVQKLERGGKISAHQLLLRG